MASHKWVKGLAEGTLPEAALIAWAQQCRLFCMQEHRALLIMRALNPAAELGTQLDKTMERLEFKLEDDTIREPRELADTLKSLHAPLVEEAWPVCLGYGSFVITCARDGLLEGLGAIYACERAYLDTWTAVLPSVPPGSKWHDWVDNWTQDLFRETVENLGRCVDELAGQSPSKEVQKRMHTAFRGVAQFELAFWEMSWKQQGWPQTKLKEVDPSGDAN